MASRTSTSNPRALRTILGAALGAACLGGITPAAGASARLMSTAPRPAVAAGERPDRLSPVAITVADGGWGPATPLAPVAYGDGQLDVPVSWAVVASGDSTCQPAPSAPSGVVLLGPFGNSRWCSPQARKT
jgi:hypothetical protein